MKRLMKTALIALMVLALVACAGCKKKKTAEPAAAPAAEPASAPVVESAPAPAEEPAAAPAEEPAAAPAEEPAAAPAEEPAEEPAAAPAEEPVAGIPNPWSETKDASEAITGAGLDDLLRFSSRIPQKLFGLELQGFRYMAGTLEADYANSANEAFLRISKNASGIEGLAGDYNEYSQEWNVAVYGVNLQARGGQDRVNVAAFDALGFHFAVGCNLGNEGAGVPLNAVQSLVPRVRIPDSFLKLIGK